VISPNPRFGQLLMRRSFRVLLPIVLVLAAVSSQPGVLAASKPKGKPYALIAGTVWGPDDHPVYGVTVKIRRAKDKKPKWQVYSDHLGEFAQVPMQSSTHHAGAPPRRTPPAPAPTTTRTERSVDPAPLRGPPPKRPDPHQKRSRRQARRPSRRPPAGSRLATGRAGRRSRRPSRASPPESPRSASPRLPLLPSPGRGGVEIV